MVAQLAPAALALVRSPLPSADGRDLPSVPSSTGGGARCHRCVVPRFVLLFGGRGGCLKNRRDLHPIHRRYRRWRVLMYGRVVPTMPTRELYVQGNQGHSPGIETPLLTTEDHYSLRWAVYVSYLPPGSVTWGSGSGGWDLYPQSLACCTTGFHRPRWSPIAGRALCTWSFLYCTDLWTPCLRMLGCPEPSRGLRGEGSALPPRSRNSAGSVTRWASSRKGGAGT